MRKILAFVICSLLVFSLSFTLLPISFSLLTAWLGPVFGASIHVLLAMIFILFGDPLKYPALIGLWVTAGFLCGLIVRRRLGSVSSASSVFSAMFLVITVAGLRVFEIMEETGFANLLSVLPPLPPGTTLETIFAAPIISDVYALWQKTSLRTLQSPTAILSPLMGILIFNLVKNLSLIILSAIGGCETGKLLERILLSKKKPKSVPDESKTDTVALKNPTNICQRSRLTMLFFVGILAISVVSPALGSLNNSPYYTEGIFGFTTSDGTAYLASLFADSDIDFAHMNLSAPEFENAVAGILISHDTSPDTLPPILTSPSIPGEVTPMNLPQSLIGNLTMYYQLVPKTLFLTVYIEDDVDVARQKADSAASLFSATFGTSLSYLVSLPQEMEIGGTKRNIVLFVYQSDTPLSEVGNNIMGYLPLNRNGLANLTYTAYESGILTPRETGRSANGTVMMVGFLSSSMILNLLETADLEGLEPIGAILPSSTTPTPMLGVFSYWIGRFHSSSFLHQFNINDLLGNVEPIQFSPESTISLIMTAAPNATIQDGKVTFEQLIVNVVTSVDLSKPEFKQAFEAIQKLSETGSLTLVSAEKGSLIRPEDLTVSFVQVLPLNVRIEKLVTLSELEIGQTLDVTVRVINNDETDAAENVTLDDRFLLRYYELSSIELAKGSLTHTWSKIRENSSETHTYSILLKKEGIYTLPAAEMTYDYMGNTYTAKSNYVYVKVRPPPLPSLLVSGVPSAWAVLTRALDRIPGLSGKGSLLLSCLTIAILGVLSFNEYRDLRKWLRTRKQKLESKLS